MLIKEITLQQTREGAPALSDSEYQHRVAHELLIDFAEFDKAAGLKVADFAKRLQDYGFHPPTVSWPTTTCMLIEPTESESLEEIDRFVQRPQCLRNICLTILLGFAMP